MILISILHEQQELHEKCTNVCLHFSDSKDPRIKGVKLYL